MIPYGVQDRVDKQALLTLQIVVASLVAGCTVFLVIAVVIVSQRAIGPAAGQTILTYLAVGVTVLSLVARMVVPGVITASKVRQFSQQPEETADVSATVVELWKLLTTSTIVGGALLEGAAFFALVTYMVEGSPLSLALAVVLIAGLAVQFPTRSRAADWLDARLAEIQHQRQFRP